MVRYVVSVING